MKIVKIVFWPYHCVEEAETKPLVKTTSKSDVGHGRTLHHSPAGHLPTRPMRLLRPDWLTRPEYQLTPTTCIRAVGVGRCLIFCRKIKVLKNDFWVSDLLEEVTTIPTVYSTLNSEFKRRSYCRSKFWLEKSTPRHRPVNATSSVPRQRHIISQVNSAISLVG